MRSDRTMWRVALVAVAIGLGGPASAQSGGGPSPAPDDAAAHSLLEQVANAYKALTSYSDQGEFVVAMTLGGKAHRQVRPLKLTFVRPNKLDLDAGAVRLTSDGKTLTTAIEPLKKYMSAAAPETISINTFREGPTGAVLFGGQTAAPTASPMFVLLNLLIGANPDVMLDQMGGTLHAAPANGAKSDGATLLIDLQEGPDLLLRVDPATKLLSAIELKIDPAQLAKSAPPGQTLAIDKFGWTSGTVSTQLAADRSFAFVAPKGFTPIEGVREQPGGAVPAPQYAVQEKLGKPAPDFSLTLSTDLARPGPSPRPNSPARSSSSTSGRPGAGRASWSCPRSRSSSSITMERRRRSSSSRSARTASPRRSPRSASSSRRPWPTRRSS